MNSTATLNVGLAQIAPVWMNRTATLEKVIEHVNQAGREGCDLIVFGEGLVPGYPFWLERTDAARFEAPELKEMHAIYLDQAVVIERGDLDGVCAAAREQSTAVYLGIIERPGDRGGHSVYCSIVYIDKKGVIGSSHRKLRPTHEERLAWASGDGHGLRVHDLGDGFRVGGLNCWENWMPLTRAALYAQGENVHVANWPGSPRNTREITRFIAMESRSFVVSVSGLMAPDDVPHGFPMKDKLNDAMATGGSCVAGPDGSWLLEPTEKSGLHTVDLNLDAVFQARQSFDPSGHYSRPDVTRLIVDRTRQSSATFIEQNDEQGHDKSNDQGTS